MKPFDRLQLWFNSQCNGDWEHGTGIAITTLDNPGWLIKIDLQGSDLEDAEFETFKELKSNMEWIHASRTENIVRISCSPENLDKALAIFCDWAGV